MGNSRLKISEQPRLQVSPVVGLLFSLSKDVSGEEKLLSSFFMWIFGFVISRVDCNVFLHVTRNTEFII